MYLSRPLTSLVFRNIFRFSSTTTVNKLKPDPKFSRSSHRLNPLPAELEKAIDIVISDQDLNQLGSSARLLRNQLWIRKEPVEGRQIQQRADELQTQMFGDRLAQLDKHSRQAVLDQVHTAIVEKLKKNIYQWKSMAYDDYGALCYLVGRLPMEFAVLRRVFEEISLLDPSFKPESCLDFGSGLGSVFWALRQQYAASFNEYFSVEIQPAMHNLAVNLIKGGVSENRLPFDKFYQRAKLPSNLNMNFDVAVSSFSLLDLPSKRERLAAIETLWNRTNHLLVIIENGNRSGFRMVNEARDMILSSKKNSQASPAYVLAPCTHSFQCPKAMAEMSSYPCSFPAKFTNLDDRSSEYFSYSYVVLSKSKPELQNMARIVQAVLPRSRHAICRICTSKGELSEIIVTKKKHTKEIYSKTRFSRWGDLYPFEHISSASGNDESDR